ncbi:BnaAnng16020D [Brassica napus]|uniref:BnaAnng16020D protein n=2 Tax=Brassica napus TaxID=3708 RepID=A0A078J5C2_BRANA|nr:BnaAnng16020D [Brassica napus]
MEARFSIDPILRLIAALSRDLKDDFAPFLPRVVNSLVVLLNNGGQKDAETIEQIFTSWSEIIENLRFCFSRDIQGALRNTPVTLSMKKYQDRCHVCWI